MWESEDRCCIIPGAFIKVDGERDLVRGIALCSVEVVNWDFAVYPRILTAGYKPDSVLIFFVLNLEEKWCRCRKDVL